MSKLPQIPGYRIIKKLGQGGMADVYLGVQEKLQRNVAIKVMVPALFRDEQFSKRFIKEAQTAAQLNHPNIITIHDVGEAGHFYYIVMEYLEETLSDRLKQKGSISPGIALEIVKMIAGALDYAHKMGFIHRDIKPDNIMFRLDGTVVLVDFGIARAMDSSTQLTRTGMSIGTPHYMSPEQCKGEKIDGRSDIYSLGVQLYEMLTGDVPYKAENTAGIIIKQIQDPVPLLPDSMGRYQQLIDKMMAKDRVMRTQSGADLIRFIDGLITSQQYIPPPTTLPEETVILEEPTIRTSVPRVVDVPSTPTRLEEREGKKWLLPVMAAVMVILAAVLLFLIFRTPLEDNDQTGLPVREKQEQTLEKKQSVDQSPVEKEEKVAKKDTPPDKKENIEKKDTSPVPGEEKKGEEKKSLDAGEKPKKTGTGETRDTGTGKTVTDRSWAGEQETGVPGDKQPAKKKDFKPPVKTVTLLGLSPGTRQIYNTKMQRIQVPLSRARFRVGGQITVDLLINERGKIAIESFQSMLKVFPAVREKQVENIIKRWVSTLTLPSPKDKQGKPVRFNWRLTYKVGKLGNKIFLNKQ